MAGSTNDTTVLDGQTELSGAGIRRAAQRLAGRVVRTPVLRSLKLDLRAGTRLWLKAEHLQRSGSFKIRGALLAAERLAGAAAPGVVVQSTGNHGIAVAAAIRDHGLPAVVVLPENATPTKVRLVREAGAEVILAGTTLAERLARVDEVRAARGFEVIDPYQDPQVVLGQGTATAELVEQVASAGSRLDSVILPVGGGSALAGACLATTGQTIALVAAEPSAVPALTAALAAGHPVTVAAAPTIADGLRPDRIGQLPYDLCAGRVTRVVTVPEPAIAEAMRLARAHADLLIEPAAATGLAVALGLAGGCGPWGDDVGVLLTGGNVDTDGADVE